MRPLSLGWVIPALLGLGCGATLTQVFSAGIPTAQVSALEVRLEQPTLARVQFALSVPNPRALDFEVRRVGWALRLRGRPFAEGVVSTAPVVQGSGAAAVRIQMPVAFLEAPAPGAAGAVLNGSITARLGDDERTWVFDHAGAVTLQEPPVP
ncbi:MAG: hypothetical protein M3Y59_23495 [Myxococcota bacterium]|nr:hypothetical protein [Myxococcota bacterium]